MSYKQHYNILTKKINNNNNNNTSNNNEKINQIKNSRKIKLNKINVSQTQKKNKNSINKNDYNKNNVNSNLFYLAIREVCYIKDIISNNLILTNGSISATPENSNDIINKSYADSVFTISHYATNPDTNEFIGIRRTDPAYNMSRIVIPVNTTLRRLTVSVENPPGIGETYSYIIYKNGISTDNLLIITDNVDIAIKTDFNIQFNAGDSYSIFLIDTAQITGSNATNIIVHFSL